jgi:hypothetical protein
MTDLKGINGGADGPTATIEQIAAMEFKGASRLARMSRAERVENLHAMSSRVYQAATIACELYTRDKEDVIKLVAESFDKFGPALMELADAANDARALLDVISSGEARLAVALAVVEGNTEPPPDDGGGETLAA